MSAEQDFVNRQHNAGNHLSHNVHQTIAVTTCGVSKRLKVSNTESVRVGGRATFRDSVIVNYSEWNYKEIIADPSAEHQVSLIIHKKAQLKNCVRLLRKMPRDLKYTASCQVFKIRLSVILFSLLPALETLPSIGDISESQFLHL